MRRTIALCFLVALFEGLDIQAMGVAAPRVAAALGMGPQQMGVVLSASIVGLMIGAAWGGRASDRHGRIPVLTLSLATFGCFSLATVAAHDFTSMAIMRVLAGLGLGGALPNLIALATDVAPPRHRVMLLGIVYAGLPIGGAIAGVIAGLIDPGSWKPVFIVGGIGPLLLAVPMAFVALSTFSARGTERRPTHADGGDRQLLLEKHRLPTLLLWTAYFFTLLAVYLLLNWLPTLMAARDHDSAAAPRAAIYLNIGAAIGSLLLGRLSDNRSPRAVLTVTYFGMLLSLALLVILSDKLVMGACFFAGFFVIGGQLVLYALAPSVYPAELRGTGIGAAVAAGRAGSVFGPLLGGLALAAGASVAAVPAIATPGLLVAFVSAWALVGRLEGADKSAIASGQP